MATKQLALRRFAGAPHVITSFVAKRTIRLAILWGYVFGATIASSAIGYIGIYKTLAARQAFADSFGGNVGIRAIIGMPHHLETVAGFTAWRSLGIIILIGSIWAILTASRTFRGDEAAGRWEMFLVGQTTARRATALAIAGLGIALLPIFLLVAAATYAASLHSGVDFSLQASLYFGLAAVTAPAIMLSVGALASQIQPTRGRAAGMTAAVFGLSFALRGAGNAAASLHWLVDISPLGWVEQLQPLTGSRPLWLLPICLCIAVVSAAAVHLAGRRDLGESVLPDKDSATPRLALLGSPLPIAWRLSRIQILVWTAGLTVFSIGFSSLTKAASDAIKVSSGAEQALGHLAGQLQQTATLIFLGLVFLIIMTIMLLAVAAALNAIRDEEAEGYLDNLLVQPVSRLQWLAGRLLLVIVMIVVMGLLASSGVWLGSHAASSGVSAWRTLQAGLNAMAPAVLLAGLGVLTFGFAPRWVSRVLYGVVAWSFLMQMLGSIGNLNHWLLDTSLLHHIALAPTVAPNWHIVWVYLGAGLIAGVVGVWRFNFRDLQNE